MQPKSQEQYYSYSSPISLLEELLFQLDWNYERLAESEIAAEIEGRWCSYRLFALWKEDLECFMFSSLIDLKIPHIKREAIEILLSMLNPKLLLGHFEVSPDDEVSAFRYTLTLRGNPGATLEQMEEIINAAITECDRLYPALQFVLWGGKSPEEAMAAAMLDTCGEA
ncbi:MAG: YbjN domain-containing protein [Alphaproteobacteria bacterium]|nr:YbjN domain-containing protein [Alphaproteobacteria bacterium]